MTASLLFVVAAGGLVGAPSRYLLDRAVSRRFDSDLPWGTLLVNVSGSFVLGLVTGLALRGQMPSLSKALIGTGFCGAYTTFSTFSFETLRLMEAGRLPQAAINVVASTVVGLAAATAGVALGLAI